MKTKQNVTTIENVSLNGEDQDISNATDTDSSAFVEEFASLTAVADSILASIVDIIVEAVKGTWNSTDNSTGRTSSFLLTFQSAVEQVEAASNDTLLSDLTELVREVGSQYKEVTTVSKQRRDQDQNTTSVEDIVVIEETINYTLTSSSRILTVSPSKLPYIAP
jgi:hypothetical protein